MTFFCDTDFNPDDAELAVLSVGGGDTKLTFGPGDEDNARKTIEDMLRQGFGIFIEGDDGKLHRVRKFHPAEMAYIVEAPKGAKDKKDRKVPVRGTKGRAVGATAGG